MSTDRHLRAEGVDWWADEVPSLTDMIYALENLERNGNAVDIVLTHTAPAHLILKHMNNAVRASDATASFLDFVDENIRYRDWYFGHFHKDETLDDRYHAVYKVMITLNESNYE